MRSTSTVGSRQLNVSLKRPTDSLQGNTVNGRTADIHITTHGSDFYWAICACMTVATIAFIGLSLTKPRQDRIFHYITAGITMVAAIAYFTMASNLGFTPIGVEFHRSDHRVAGNYREIFYARYVDWSAGVVFVLKFTCLSYTGL